MDYCIPQRHSICWGWSRGHHIRQGSEKRMHYFPPSLFLAVWLTCPKASTEGELGGETKPPCPLYSFSGTGSIPSVALGLPKLQPAVTGLKIRECSLHPYTRQPQSGPQKLFWKPTHPALPTCVIFISLSTCCFLPKVVQLEPASGSHYLQAEKLGNHSHE